MAHDESHCTRCIEPLGMKHDARNPTSRGGFTEHPTAGLYDISLGRTDLLVSETSDMFEDAPLWRVPIIGGTPRRLGNSAHDARWSPDGKKLAYEREQTKEAQWRMTPLRWNRGQFRRGPCLQFICPQSKSENFVPVVMRVAESVPVNVISTLPAGS